MRAFAYRASLAVIEKAAAGSGYGGGEDNADRTRKNDKYNKGKRRTKGSGVESTETAEARISKITAASIFQD